MKKKYGINIFLIILSNVLYIACILIAPFFFQWYEKQLGKDANGIYLVIAMLGFLIWFASVLIQAGILNHKYQYNEKIK